MGYPRILGRLPALSLAEGMTLVLLLFVAVPLKHVFGLPIATRLMGSVHGVTFALFMWTAIRSIAGGGWPRWQAAVVLIAAMVPFGALLTRPLLHDAAGRGDHREAGPS